VIDEARAPMNTPDRFSAWCMNFDFERPIVVPVVLTFDSRAIHITLDPPARGRRPAASIPWKVMRNRGAHNIAGAGLVIQSIAVPFRLGLPPEPLFGYLNSGGPPIDGIPDEEDEAS
jgi:hypothetical protein